jgi:hypothetical protein
LSFSSLMAGVLVAAAPAAMAQDPPSAAPQAAISTPPAAQSQTGGQADSGTKATKSADPVCFKLTGHCVENVKAGTPPATKSGASSPKDSSGAQKPLNLTAPDVRTVVSPEELKEPLPSNEQITETEEADTVAVKGEADAPDVPGGFGALWWALNHPSQAWRIVAPAE